MAYSVNIFVVYTVSLVVYTLQGNFYKLDKVKSCTFTPHLIMGQVFYGTDP